MSFKSTIVPSVRQETVGTSAVQLSASTVPELAYNIIFSAPSSNAGRIYIGDENVTTSRYAFSVGANNNRQLEIDPVDGFAHQYDLSSFYAIASAAGQAINVAKFVKKRTAS